MIRNQKMSAKDARELRMSISNSESDLEKHRQLQRDSMARVEELQMQHNRCHAHLTCPRVEKLTFPQYSGTFNEIGTTSLQRTLVVAPC